MLKDLLKFFIGTGVIASLIGFLAQRIINYNFEKRTEGFKYELERINIEYQIRYSKLHEERALIIAELYSKLVRVENSMGSFVAIFEPAGQPPKEEKEKIAAKDFNDFIEYFQKKEIYFSDDITEAVYKIIEQIKDAWYKFIMYPSYKETKYFLPDPELAKLEQKKMENWLASWKIIGENVPALKKELKIKLQTLLGVEKSTSIIHKS